MANTRFKRCILGRLGTAAIGTVLAWFVLAILIKLDKRIDESDPNRV